MNSPSTITAEGVSKSMLFLISICVIAFGILTTWNLADNIDVLGWDEGVYMQNGLLFVKKLQKSWGPMYAAWYYFLHQFQSHPLYLYYLNFQVLTVLPGFLLFIYWTRIGIRPFISAIMGMFFMASFVNFHSWPKISLFTTSILIAAFIVGTFARNTVEKLCVITGGVLIASYMRPELYLAFFVLLLSLLVVIIYSLFKKKEIGQRGWILLGGLFLGIAGLQWKLGNPLFSMEGARAIAAFAQHYAYNFAIWNDLRMDRWQLHGEQIFVADFGRNFDFFSAYKANPDAFVRHVSSNTLNFFKNLGAFYTDLFLPESIFKLKAGARAVVLAVPVLGLIAFKKISFRLWFERMKESWLEWLLLIVVIGPTFISVILIFPREHYMVMQTLLILTLILSISFGFTGWDSLVKDRTKLGWVSGIMMALLILSPSSKDRPYYDNYRDPKGTFNKQSVLLLEKFDYLKDTIIISEDEGGITFFLREEDKKHFKWTPAMWKKTDFTTYADSMQTDVYYVTPLLLYDDRYRYDTAWQQFLSNYSEKGFKKASVAKEWYFLYDSTVMKLKE